MKSSKSLLAICIFTCLLTIQAFAQETIVVSGGDTITSGGSVSISIGQPFFSNFTGSGGKISEGVQQTYEIETLTSIDNTHKIELYCSVYPNPTSRFLHLKVEKYSSKALEYMLFDNTGKLLFRKNITRKLTKINMESYVSASYFLRVISEKKEIKVFKIVKN